ncbi:MAG: DNA primase [Clostridia bacterium]|nr:DNA primase [Clostridia bacterium]
MPKNFSNDLVEEIRMRADIVDVISEYVRLEKKGRLYEGLCPFHYENTPSFKVNREKQFYHCFGCGAGGDIYSFVMNKERLTFVEVLEKLADRYGIQLSQRELSFEQKEKNKKAERMVEANALAAKYFNYLLNQPQGALARNYLIKRGITQVEIDKFQLGYAMNSWDDFVNLAKTRGFSEEELVEAGLAAKRDSGIGSYDRFRNRLMFTIYNPKGQPVGFGGRVLDDSLPKYLNTGETPVFNKGSNLYGLNWAGSSIRQQGYVIIMEGYMDVIAAVQHGIENVVASLGTAFTREQAMLLKRYTDKVIICYDADAAGEKAALRGMDILRDEKCQVKVISLPKGQDPDDFIRKVGTEKFTQIALNEAKSLIEYKLALLLNHLNTETGDGKVEIFNQLKPDLQKVSNAIEREEYINLISGKLAIPEGAIREELAKQSAGMQENGIYRDKNVKNRNTINGLATLAINKPVAAHEQAERQLFFFMMEDENVRKQVIAVLGNIFFTNSLFNRLFKKVQEKWQQGLEVSPAWVISCCANEDERRIVVKVLNQEMPEEKIKYKLIADCIQNLNQRQKQEQIIVLRQQLKEAETAGDLVKMKNLLSAIQQLMS